MKKWDWMRERKAEFQKEFVELNQLLIDQPDYQYRSFVEEDIVHTEKILGIIRKTIPE